MVLLGNYSKVIIWAPEFAEAYIGNPTGKREDVTIIEIHVCNRVGKASLL